MDKESLTRFINELLYEKMSIDDYKLVMDRLGVECKGNRYRTVCHNIDGGGFNLSFDEETRSFYCFSECCCSYSLLSLIKKVRSLKGIDNRTIPSLKWLCDILGVECNFKDIKINTDLYNWKGLLKYKNKIFKEENNIYDKYIINCLDKVIYEPWINEGITAEIQDKWGIRWYDKNQQVVIPVLNKDGELVGTHCRNTNPDYVADGFKYDHLRLVNGSEFKFQMGLELFGLNYNKVNIEHYKEFILVESPKSVMQFDNFNIPNICVGMFGMNFSLQKLKLLLTLGAESVIIALDKQYNEIDETENSEWDKYKKKVNKIIDICRPYMKKIKVIYDKENLLDYKDSPTDKGEEIFRWLLNNAEII